jgi:hypothetical protein
MVVKYKVNPIQLRPYDSYIYRRKVYQWEIKRNF